MPSSMYLIQLAILERIKARSQELLYYKHGQKVLQKFSKSFPQVFANLGPRATSMVQYLDFLTLIFVSGIDQL